MNRTDFDILGRVTGHKQTTDGKEYETEYTYNLSGAMVGQVYPSGRRVKNVLDTNGDLSIVQSAKCLDGSPGTGASSLSQARVWNYAQHFTYNAAGAVTAMHLGNGRGESTAFNSRLQPTQITLGRDIICLPTKSLPPQLHLCNTVLREQPALRFFDSDYASTTDA